MNWYEIFYWVTVADNIKDFFDTSSNIFTWFAVIGFIVFILVSLFTSIEVSKNPESDDSKALKLAKKASAGFFYTSLVISLITWFGYMACPSKKDALIIIAGGTVGNFITSDSSAKAIPAEAMLLLRSKIKSEINELNLDGAIGDGTQKTVDTLSTKTKEELLEIIKNKK
jgi:hypothetical protein